MLSAICFKLDQSKILSSGNVLKRCIQQTGIHTGLSGKGLTILPSIYSLASGHSERGTSPAIRHGDTFSDRGPTDSCQLGRGCRLIIVARDSIQHGGIHQQSASQRDKIRGQ